jgi:hypothetical protein
MHLTLRTACNKDSTQLLFQIECEKEQTKQHFWDVGRKYITLQR